MSDTIFYKGVLKRGKDPLTVFEKITKGIGKRGPSKNWTFRINEEKPSLFIDFHDNKSETFSLEFNEKGEFDGFCKVAFPLEGELFEDGKSEFKALLDALYKAKSMFRKIEVTDDYGLAESYWDSKRFKLHLRDLTAEEDERVRRLYARGSTTPEQLLRSVMAEDMEMPVEELRDYVNVYVNCLEEFPDIRHTLDVYLYETAEFRKEGRVCEMPVWQYYEPGIFMFSEFAFVEGISWVFLDGTGEDTVISLEKKRAFSQKDAQVGLLFREKFAPAFIAETDPLEKCILVYRYFVSVYDDLGFCYVGRTKDRKTVMEKILEEYGGEKGTIYLTCYCTTERYIFQNSNQETKKQYTDCLITNMTERYGKDFFSEYLPFKRKYEGDMKFRRETKYVADRKLKYIDDSLVL